MVCCAVLLCCAVLCCAVLYHAGPCRAVPCCVGLVEQMGGDISFEAIFLAGVAPSARDMYAAGAYQNLTGVERCGTRRGELDARMRGILLLRFDNS